ncbi:MAG: NADH-quinone oxidoreductase subunit M, partial [Sandaracinaceae bacterium]|nr:NADH-quinone oxidoreductase subunit M [Sandaracinaceae bacterium]
MNFPILTALFALPLIASLILLALPKGAVRAQRGLTGGALLLSLGLALALPFLGDYSTGEDVLRESYPWIPALGITLTLGVDGLSVFLVILSAFLAGIAFVAALAREEAMKFQGSAILLSLFAVFGCFLARDLFLFFLGWEAMLIPTYLFMNRFGGEEGKRAALRFFLYSFAGSAPFLIAFVYRVAEYQALSGNMSFELEALGSVVSPRTTQALLFSAFALAFAVKMPIFPFHTWSPNAYAFAPTPASILLGALLLTV